MRAISARISTLRCALGLLFCLLQHVLSIGFRSFSSFDICWLPFWLFAREANISAQRSAALRADIACPIYSNARAQSRSVSLHFEVASFETIRIIITHSCAMQRYISAQCSAALRADIASFIISTAELESQPFPFRFEVSSVVTVITMRSRQTAISARNAALRCALILHLLFVPTSFRFRHLRFDHSRDTTIFSAHLHAALRAHIVLSWVPVVHAVNLLLLTCLLHCQILIKYQRILQRGVTRWYFICYYLHVFVCMHLLLLVLTYINHFVSYIFD